jgi:hypothetical protein
LQLRDSFLEQARRDPGIDQSAEKHIAADAGKTIKISNAHGTVVGHQSLVVGLDVFHPGPGGDYRRTAEFSS